MACPTCDHTMQCVGSIEYSDARIFWCPRCGTLRHVERSIKGNPITGTYDKHHVSDEPTKLAQRVRALLPQLTGSLYGVALTEGIVESCTTPDIREAIARAVRTAASQGE